MNESTNRCLRLRTRPSGRVERSDFDLCHEPVPEPGPGQALVRTCYLSLDPTNRIWMSDMDQYMPPVELGEVMRGLGIGEVVASEREDLPEGALVHGATGWQDYAIADPSDHIPFTPLPAELPVPLPAMLGVLGITGMTAYFGMEDIGKPQEGETVVVSAAAGAVGSVAGQIAKIHGARVVGIAGTRQKCDWVVDELGFDAAVCHRDPGWREQLAAACPDRIDVDFENVGGEIMDEIFARLSLNARVVLCGLISQYNEAGEWAGPRNFPQLLMKRAVLRGFIILDFAERYEEAVEALGGWLAEGRLHYRDTVHDGGLEAAPEALNRLFDGDTMGKLVLQVAETAAPARS